MDQARQFYLEGFEGCNIAPAAQKMVEAYVNGVDGESVDNLTLCKIMGSRVRSASTARTTIWKIFNGKTPSAEHLAMREFASWLQSRNLAKSDVDAVKWREKVQTMVLMGEGLVPQRRVVTASHKGFITIKEVLVKESNLPAMGQALKMQGEHMGILKSDGDAGADHEDWVTQMQPESSEQSE